MEEQSVEVARSVYEAFGKGDVPAVLGAMTADIEWYEAEGMPYGGVYHGGEEVAQNVFGPIVDDILDFAVTPEEFIASGSTVAVVARYSGTAKGTGSTLNLPAVHVWDVRDGKVARFRQFIDTVKFSEAVPAEVAGRS
jgi:ketosteroid isomerase-like protein